MNQNPSDSAGVCCKRLIGIFCSSRLHLRYEGLDTEGRCISQSFLLGMAHRPSSLRFAVCPREDSTYPSRQSWCRVVISTAFTALSLTRLLSIMSPGEHDTVRGLGSTLTKNNNFTPGQILVEQALAITCAGISIIVGSAASYWFIRMRRTFRHKYASAHRPELMLTIA